MDDATKRSAAGGAGHGGGGCHRRQEMDDWGTFVDVGSGSGIGVFAAYLALPFSVCAVSPTVGTGWVY